MPAASESRRTSDGLRSGWVLGVSVLAAAGLRLFLFFIGAYELLGDRSEVSSPISSYKRVQEGLYLEKLGLSAYQGDAFHQSPLVLALFQAFPSGPSIPIWLLYISVDIVVALVLREIAMDYFLKRNVFGRFLSLKQIAKAVAGEDVPAMPLDKHMPNLMAMLYLFNPLVLFSCVGMSTVVFNNLVVMTCLLSALRGNLVFATFTVALATYLSVYPVVLISPVVALVARRMDHRRRSLPSLAVVSVMCVAVWFLGLLYLSFLQQHGSWAFLNEVYWFQFWAPDLSPNLGLWWYYMTEVFTELRPFFTFLYQYQLFIYILPLSLRFWKRPLFLFWSCLGVIAILKPYVTVGDVALHLAILPLFHVVVAQNSWNMIALRAAVLLSLLSPVLWQLWLYQGDGNPNYFYGMTLIYALIHGWLFTDTLLSALVLNYYEKHPPALVEETNDETNGRAKEE